MNTLKRYTINWKGLQNGPHHFDFEVDRRFFEAFEGSDIRDGKADVSVEMQKSSNMLMLDIAIEGEVMVDCDRCLDELAYPIDYRGELKVKFSDEERESDGEVMWINPSDSELPLAQYIYESIVLELPYTRVHGEDENGRSLCNPDMTSRFSVISGEEFDRLHPDTETVGESAGADKLRELKEKMEKK